MADYKFEPITALSEEVIDNLNIHTTVSSLRRAAAVTPCMKKVEGTQDLPTIYYIKGDKDPEINDWTRHALVSDINRYLLLQLTGSDNTDTENGEGEEETEGTELPKLRSTLVWDGSTGKTETGAWSEPTYGDNDNDGFEEDLIFRNSVIAFYGEDPTAGTPASNMVGVVLTPAEGMLEAYPNVTITVDSNYGLTEGLTFIEGKFVYYPLAALAEGETDYQGNDMAIRVIWSEDFEESFRVVIEDSCTLQPAE